MSNTIALARKYRPRTFAQMVGQEHVVQALGNALSQQRLHHAYLFTGTRGIGKTTVSRILAKSLNCTGPDGSGGITAEPCGVCQACTEIDADRFIDYIELDAASNRGIDEVREMIERAAYKPGVGRCKVFMIDEAHQLTKEAFNALLKTLEEPPDYLKFVLATTDPEKMLPTVLSRCLQFNLRPMAPATVRAHLEQVLRAEGVAFDDGALRLLARGARGSMRDGLSLADQAIAYGGGHLSEEVVRTMLGSVDRGHARELVQALARRDGRAVLAAVDGLRGLGLSAAGTLEAMAMLLQQMAIEQAVPGALDAHEPEAAELPVLAGLLAADETQLLYSIVLHGRDELRLMSDEYGALTMVLLRFLAFPPAAGNGAPARVAPRSEASARVAPLRAPAPPALTLPATLPGAAGGGSASRSSAPAAAARGGPAVAAGVTAASGATGATGAADPAQAVPVADAAGSPDMAMPGTPDRDLPGAPAEGPASSAIGERWAGLVRRLCEQGAVTALVRELAMQSGLSAVDDAAVPPVWRLLVERESLHAPALRDKLAAALSAELGQPLVLAVEAGVPADTPARREAAERQRRQAAAEETIRNDPVVRELMTQFKGARIVPGSIKPV